MALIEKITGMLEQIGDSLPRLQTYSTLFPTNCGLQEGLYKIYVEILRFSIEARRVFINNNSGMP